MGVQLRRGQPRLFEGPPIFDYVVPFRHDIIFTIHIKMRTVFFNTEIGNKGLGCITHVYPMA